MSDFVSGNSFNHVLLEVKLYETKRENNWSSILEKVKCESKKIHLFCHKIGVIPKD